MTKVLTLSLVLYCSWVQAQLQKDSLFLEAAIKNNILFYAKSIQGQTSLYNGGLYVPPRQTNDQHPFFESYDWVTGDVIFDSQLYENVPLLYDITSDRLITENYYNATEITLMEEKLSRFTIGDHTFVKLDHKTLPKAGFYELLYKGPSSVVARHQKIIRERIVDRSIEIDFNPKNRYFIFKNGAYFPVKGKATVLKIFEDEKPALKQFIRKSKIRFKANPEKALSLMAEKYDILKKRS
jgi:hypothetical protein